LQAIHLDELGGAAFEIVINATSAGLSGSPLAIPDSIFAPNCLAYDMMYGRETPFMQQAKRCGARAADGLGMLLEQAAEAFAIWRGVRPNTQALLKQLSL
jgi:shikimate dehydrogenase